MERGAGRHVLVVDDAPEVLRLVTVILQRAGYIVIGAGSVAEARERLADRSDYSAAIIDLHLPDSPGTGLVDLVRRAAPDARCIAISGDSHEGMGRAASEAGFDGFLPKPFPLEMLCGLLGLPDDALSA